MPKSSAKRTPLPQPLRAFPSGERGWPQIVAFGICLGALDGSRPGWNFGLELPIMARTLLSDGPPGEASARILFEPVRHGGAERRLLSSAHARVGPVLA